MLTLIIVYHTSTYTTEVSQIILQRIAIIKSPMDGVRAWVLKIFALRPNFLSFNLLLRQ